MDADVKEINTKLDDLRVAVARIEERQYHILKLEERTED